MSGRKLSDLASTDPLRRHPQGAAAMTAPAEGQLEQEGNIPMGEQVKLQLEIEPQSEVTPQAMGALIETMTQAIGDSLQPGQHATLTLKIDISRDAADCSAQAQHVQALQPPRARSRRFHPAEEC